VKAQQPRSPTPTSGKAKFFGCALSPTPPRERNRRRNRQQPDLLQDDLRKKRSAKSSRSRSRSRGRSRSRDRKSKKKDKSSSSKKRKSDEKTKNDKYGPPTTSKEASEVQMVDYIQKNSLQQLAEKYNSKSGNNNSRENGTRIS